MSGAAALERSGIDRASVQEVFMGNVVSAGIGQVGVVLYGVSSSLPMIVPTLLSHCKSCHRPLHARPLWERACPHLQSAQPSIRSALQA